MKIPLGKDAKDGYTEVDDDRLDLLSAKWYLGGSGYAQSSKGEYLHHKIIGGSKKGHYLDHISRDKLDNRSKNLRYVTASENAFNSGARKANKCGYKNINWDSANNKWRVTLRVQGKTINYGRFKELKDAIKTRDKLIQSL